VSLARWLNSSAEPPSGLLLRSLSGSLSGSALGAMRASELRDSA
jgi:hypothetical protein